MKTIYVNNTELTQGKQFTYLASDATASGTALVVQSIVGFNSLTTSSGQIVLIGEIGGEKSEILRTDQNNAANGTTVSLRDALQFNHPQDTKVYILDWNRIDIQHAASVTGTKSTIRAYPANIRADLLETPIQDSSQTSGFYFTRFNETIGNTTSDWSDAIPFSGYDDNMVASIKKRALDQINEVIDDNVTDDMLNSWLWEARREYHQAPGKRPFRRKFNTDIGNVTTGMYRIDLPTDTEKPFTSDNIYGVRIGTEENMEYIDKRNWDEYYRNIPHSTLSTAYTVGDQDLYLSDVRDFDDSGSVEVEQDTIAYSAKGVSGGTLRISTAGSAAHSSGLDVWQNVSHGLPDKFTVFADPEGSAYIYFNRPVDTAYVNQNIYLDYYRTLVGYDSDADVLDEPSYDMYVDYLAAKIRHRKSKGEIKLQEDSNFIEFARKKKTALDKEYLGADINLVPDIDHLL